jgi:hypothetical protein
MAASRPAPWQQNIIASARLRPDDVTFVLDQIIAMKEDPARPLGALPVAADIFARHRFGFGTILVAEHPAGEDRRRRCGVVYLGIDAPVVRHLRDDRVPRFLRDDEQPDAEPGHDLRRFRRHGGGIAAPFERLRGAWSHVFARLLIVFAIEFAIALLEAGQHHLRRFDEPHCDACRDRFDVQPIRVGGHKINQHVGDGKLPEGASAPVQTRFLCRACREEKLEAPDDYFSFFISRKRQSLHSGCAEHGGPRSEVRYRGRYANAVEEDHE